MEGLEDQFPSEDPQDDDEQIKLQATISSILNSSLEDKESSAPKSSVDGNSKENLLGLDGGTLHGNLVKTSDGKTTSLHVDELLNKEVPTVLCEQDTENDSELTSEMPIMSMNERDASPITQQLQGEEMEHTEAEENFNIIENSELSPGKKQGELLMKVLDHAVTKENVASITETRQTPPKKRGRSLPVFEEDNSSVIQTSLKDGPSPEKKPRPASIGPEKGSILNSDKQKSKLPFQKKRGRSFKKVENFGEENEDVDKRKSLRAPSKCVQYNEVDSSPEKDDRDTILEDNVSKMNKKSITNLTPREERETKQSNPKKPYFRTPNIRTPKGMEIDDSFFLPEGWCFYAKKRSAPANTKLFDIYYITPPCPYHKKIRSRQELVAYFTAKGLDYDPLQFFDKNKMRVLLEKGILKYHDENTVILPSNQEVLAHLPRKAPMRKENNQDQTIKTEDEDVLSPAAKKETKQSKESFKNLMVDSKKNTTKISFPKMEPLSPSAKSQVRDKSPYVTEEKTEDKPGSLATPPKKKVGRPRKKVPLVPEVATDVEEEESVGDKAVEEKPVEERVRIRSKPPRKSPYFTSSFNGLVQSKSLAGLRRERKNCVAPPRSPYNLIQEDLFHDPWQMLIATIFLNATSGRLAIPLAMEFLKRWPTPQLACQAKVEEILNIIDSLGFGRTRAAVILRFSHEYLTKDWTLPNELYGIGDYGNDSYRIFCMKNEWKNVRSDDPMLMMYLNWRRATEHLRKRFLQADTSVNSESVNSSESSKKVLRPRVPTPSPKRRRGKGK